MGNFGFLKKIDSDLYKIADEAEKLYRDEYFDQCITQTRKFGENVCRNMLEDDCSSDDTFDNLITKLKDMSTGSDMEKEFIEDLYFIKKEGNKSAHGKNSKNSGMTALECLKRVFELSISYSVQKKGASKNLLRKDYDINLLILDKKMPKKRLVDEYLERSDYGKKPEKPQKKNQHTKTKPRKDDYEEQPSKTFKKGLSFKYKFVIFSFLFLCLLIIFFFIISL
ncbi:hypothetical protein IKQ26_04950 [bacterium]|nr:hypothetical protein [bacterium]